MNEKLSAVLWELAVKAGAIARDEQTRAQAELKSDQSYVTNVDLRLSELSVTMLSEFLPERRIITEEHLEHLEAIVNSPGDEDELIAVVDPVDGTRNYFHNMPLYGFSVGIMRNRRPWLGTVLFPALAEAVHFDGEQAWFVRDVFSEAPARLALHPTDAQLNFNAIVLCSETFTERYSWDHRRHHLMQTSCATINLCWPTMGRGIAAIFGAHLWDLAGSWPILAATGFVLKGVETGREINRYDPADYDSVTHRIKEPLFVCRNDHFDGLTQAVLPPQS